MYVSKSRGQSNCTCRAICDLSMPTFAAFVVTNTQKLASRMWPSSQNRQIHQNLSVLCNEPLIWRTSTLSFNYFNLRSKWFRKCWDWCWELQNITALFTEESGDKSQSLGNIETLCQANISLHLDFALSKVCWRSSYNSLAMEWANSEQSTQMWEVRCGHRCC